MLQITEILYLSQKHLAGSSYQTSVILPFQQSVIPKDATRSLNCHEHLKVPTPDNVQQLEHYHFTDASPHLLANRNNSEQ
jgi:hypothetical protein